MATSSPTPSRSSSPVSPSTSGAEGGYEPNLKFQGAAVLAINEVLEFPVTTPHELKQQASKLARILDKRLGIESQSDMSEQEDLNKVMQQKLAAYESIETPEDCDTYGIDIYRALATATHYDKYDKTMHGSAEETNLGEETQLSEET